MKDTLQSPVVAALLTRLFADAEQSDLKMRDVFGKLSPEERQRRMTDPNADYRAFYGMAKELHLAISPETGRLLYLLARGNGARDIVEFGTSFGISTLFLTAALQDNGGGKVIGTEFEPGKVAHARANLEAAGLGHLAEIREGDALQTLGKGLPEKVDLVLLDGAKSLYQKVLALVAPRLRPGSFLVADNAEACPDYVAQVRAPGSGYLSLPFGEEVEVTVKL